MVARARVHQHGAAHEDHPASASPDLAQTLGNLADQQHLRFLARDAAAHERKDLGLRTRALQGRDAHALMANDKRLAGFDVGQCHRPRPPRARVDGDAAVHFRPLHLHPVTRQTHRGFQVRRRVKPFGEHAVGRRWHQVDLLDVLGQCPNALGSIQQQLEQFAGGCRDLDAGVRRLVLATANLDVLDHELAAAIHHLVHDLRQRVRVDDVAA